MKWRLSLMMSASLLLAACGDSANDDLKEWVNATKAKPAGAIPPMPELKPQEEFRYGAADLRSPFAAFQLGQTAQLAELVEGCPEDAQPDPNRRKEDLERYTLETLRMIGAIGKGNQLQAVIRGSAGTNAGIVYRVSVGNYMGINHGRVVNVTSDRITLEERIPDGTGCWIKRETYVNFGE